MVKRRLSFSKRFWTWKKIVPLAVLLILLSANAVWLYQPKAPPQILAFPFSVKSASSAVPFVNLPINTTAVSLFVNDTLRDYNDMLSSKQENWANFSNIAHFFALYRPIGSWEVQVARDNGSYSDWIEFLFNTSPNPTPHTVVYPNETATYLRPWVGTTRSPTNVSINYHQTNYGLLFWHFYTSSASGESFIPFVWMTNSSLVYGDVAFNANNAATAILQYDVAVMNKQLNPRYPSWGWVDRVGTVYGRYIDAVVLFSVFFGIATGVVYLKREGVWPFHPKETPSEDPTRPPDHRPP